MLVSLLEKNQEEDNLQSVTCPQQEKEHADSNIYVILGSFKSLNSLLVKTIIFTE